MEWKTTQLRPLMPYVSWTQSFPEKATKMTSQRGPCYVSLSIGCYFIFSVFNIFFYISVCTTRFSGEQIHWQYIQQLFSTITMFTGCTFFCMIFACFCMFWYLWICLYLCRPVTNYWTLVNCSHWLSKHRVKPMGNVIGCS